MKPRDIVFISIIVLVVGGLYFLSTRAKKATPLPDIEAHRNVTSRQQCLTCHQSEMLAELEKAHKHPGKWRDERVSCLQCHKPASAGTQRSRLGNSSDSLTRFSVTSPAPAASLNRQP